MPEVTHPPYPLSGFCQRTSISIFIHPQNVPTPAQYDLPRFQCDVFHLQISPDLSLLSLSIGVTPLKRLNILISVVSKSLSSFVISTHTPILLLHSAALA